MTIIFVLQILIRQTGSMFLATNAPKEPRPPIKTMCLELTCRRLRSQYLNEDGLKPLMSVTVLRLSGPQWLCSETAVQA